MPQLARVRRLDGGVFEGALELVRERVPEIVRERGAHSGANPPDVIAGLGFAGYGDAGEGKAAVAVLRRGENGDVEGVAKADAAAGDVEGGAAREVCADAEPAGVGAHLRLLEVREVALIGAIVVDIAAALLGKDRLGEEALQGGVLDVEFDGLGGQSDGEQDQPEIQTLIVAATAISYQLSAFV